MEKNYWQKKSKEYLDFRHTSLTNIVHPILIKEVEKGGINILDFGCADGRVAKMLPDGFDISLYDKSVEMMKLAKSNFNDKTVKAYTKETKLPLNEFDSIICSMVLVCIDNEKEYNDAVVNMNRVLKQGGSTFIVLTHPCFRDKRYSDFFTDFSYEKNSYFDEAQPFQVTLFDSDSKTTFTDYHWSLSFTINTFVKNEFSLEKIIEVRDDVSDEDCNRSTPPFIILKFKKI
jgi:ubiquinone/menaquinone biosynthesis C-methylase UbiE